MANSTKEKWQEIANRGLQDRFDPETRARFDEAVKRGLITMPHTEPEKPIPDPTPIVAEQSIVTPVIDTPAQPITAQELAPQQLHNQVIGGVEGALQLGTGVFGEIVGGVTATVDLLNPLTSNDPAEVLNNVKGILQYEPRGTAEDAAIKGLAEKLAPLAPIINSVDEFTTRGADFGVDVTGSPVVGAFLKTIPAMIGEMLGFGALSRSANKVDLPNLAFKNPKDARKVLAESVLSDSPDTQNIGKTITASGNIIDNKTTNRAFKVLEKSFGEESAREVVAVMENASGATKGRVNKMLNGIKEGRINPLTRQGFSPIDVVGDAIIDRAKSIARIHKRSSERIGNVVNKLSKQKVDISTPLNAFHNKLNEMGVTFTKGDDGWITPDFSRSDFSGGSKEEMTKLINKLSNNVQGFKEAHNLKKSIRKNIDYNELGTGKVDRDSKNLLKELSSGIDDILDSTSDVYNRANIDFEKTVGLKKSFNKLAGKDLDGSQIDIFDSASSDILGNKARRITSNAPSGVVINKLIKDTDGVLGDFNVYYKDDIEALNWMANNLSNSFKLAKPNALKGNLIDAAADAAAGVPVEVQTGLAIRDRIKNLTTPDFNKKLRAYRSLANQGKK